MRKKGAEKLALPLIPIQKAPNTNIDRKIVFLDWNISWFTSVPPQQCQWMIYKDMKSGLSP
jgi:hypothetical protein